MNKLAQESDRFRRLLDEVGTEVDNLKQEIRELKRENAHLRAKLEEEHEKQTVGMTGLTAACAGTDFQN